jgi:hypothetical protein
MSEPNVPHPDELTDLLIRMERDCGRAADVLHAAARAVAGDRLELYHDDDVQSAFTVALEHVAGEVAALGALALRVRTGGAA